MLLLGVALQGSNANVKLKSHDGAQDKPGHFVTKPQDIPVISIANGDIIVFGGRVLVDIKCLGMLN